VARALDATTALDLRALSLRYDIWVGRVSMLQHDTPTRRMALGAQPRLDDTLRQVDALVARADPVLAADAAPQARRAALAPCTRSCWRWATRCTSWRCRPRTAPPPTRPSVRLPWQATAA
jgi:hypothetical protein